MNITLIYRNRFKLKRRFSIEIPENWNTLSESQLLAVSSLLIGQTTDIDFICNFFGLKKNIASQLTTFEIYNLVKAVKHLFQRTPTDHFIITSEIMPFRNLKGMKFGQFIYAETFFDMFSKGDKSALAKLCACLCYTAIFNEENIENLTTAAAKIDIVKQNAIYLNYAAIREHLTDLYPYLFSKKSVQPNGRSAPEKGNGKGNEKLKIGKSSSTWITIYKQIIEDNPLQQEDYKNAPVGNILFWLNAKLERNLKRR
ncbi:MAG: hypothetical protein JXB49_37165 [Bacteroidales bacterium]|nr:hypothetical protein [Bacteroidales bacterium]